MAQIEAGKLKFWDLLRFLLVHCQSETNAMALALPPDVWKLKILVKGALGFRVF